jgi:flagellar assembly protein FliH
MATVIRATDQNRAVQQVAFNFDDIAAQAKRYLDGVRVEANEIITAARKEAEQIKQRADVEGRAAGQKAVEQMVQQQLAQQLTTLLPALRQAVEAIQHAKQAWLTHWEKSAVHVAAAIAARIVRRQVEQQPDIAMPLVREALELAAGTSEIRIHLHPADLQSLGPQLPMLVKEVTGLGTAEIIADAEVSRGGCRVETRFGTIDQQMQTQLARIEEELT